MSWLFWTIAAWWFADAIWLRGRLLGLRVVRPTSLADDLLAIDEDGADDYRVWLAEGTQAPEPLVVAAVVHARNEGLVAVDVVPTDWSGLDALVLARRVDTRSYRRDKFALGTSAACMLVASTRHVARLGPVPEGREVSPRELATLSEQLKALASDRVAFVAGPGLKPPRDARWSAALATGGARRSRAPIALAVSSVVLWWGGFAALASGVGSLQTRAAVAGAMSLWLFHPALALGGGRWSPDDLAALIWTRPFVQLWRSLRMAIARRHDLLPSDVAERQWYAERLCELDGNGVPEGALDPVRGCPTCGSESGTPWTQSDRLRFKPGRFGWRRCDCGTVYVPRPLSRLGLEIYWRRQPEALGQDLTARWHRYHVPRFIARLRRVSQELEPHFWLDLYCGDGAFGAAATQHQPMLEVEGVDRREAVHIAARRRWLTRGHKGRWTELMRDVLPRGKYDVVSAWHALERASQPRHVLCDVRALLNDSGLLAIEMVDPHGLDARVLGRWWPGYAAPYQHQLIPRTLVLQMLKESGWRVRSVEHHVVHRPGAISWAWILACRALVPPPSPWLSDRRRRGDALAWAAQCTAAIGLPLTVALDVALWAAALASGRTNAYRIIAVVDPTNEPPPEMAPPRSASVDEPTPLSP